MGVDVNYCLILGWKLDYGSVEKHNRDLGLDESSLEDKIENLRDLYGKWAHRKNKELNFIYINDGMSGKYEIFGKRLSFADLSDGDYSSAPFIFNTVTKADKKEVLSFLSEAEQKTGLSLTPLIKDGDPKIISIFHHS